jgi:MFS family permease
MRLALSGAAQGVMSTIGPLLGGLLAARFGYPVLLIVSMGLEAAALLLLMTAVEEPRLRRLRRIRPGAGPP